MDTTNAFAVCYLYRRNNLYWASSLLKPVLWYGDCTKQGNDLVNVLVIGTDTADADDEPEIQSNWPDTYKLFDGLFPLNALRLSYLKGFDWLHGSSTDFSDGLRDGERKWRADDSPPMDADEAEDSHQSSAAGDVKAKKVCKLY
jgi:hypothetical protein